MKTSIYNKQAVSFVRAVIGDNAYIRKAAGECFGDVIGTVEVNTEIGFMTVKLHEHGRPKAEITLYKPYKDRPTRINKFFAANGYVLV